jgi:hypothetical protein
MRNEEVRSRSYRMFYLCKTFIHRSIATQHTHQSLLPTFYFLLLKNKVVS